MNKTLEKIMEQAGIYNNLAAKLIEQGKLEEASLLFSKALALNPSNDIYFNLGVVKRDLGAVAEAINAFEKALDLQPDDEQALAQLVRQLQIVCDWDRLQKLIPKLEKQTQNDLANKRLVAEMLHLHVSRCDNPKCSFEIAKNWSSYLEAEINKLHESFNFNNRSTSKIIRIGYLSNNFNDHPTAHLTLNLFKLHDRKRFEVFCYSYGNSDSSHYRQQIMKGCDYFRDLQNFSEIDIARQIYEDKIDILIDLNGYANNSKLKICAFRPTPIQVTYLGFPGTTGADFFDYIITDKIVSPVKDSSYFSEKFIYMPASYQINNSKQEISKKNYKRSDFNLPNEGIVFCSFTQPFKIEPVMFSSWMEILKKVPGSVLWLWKKNESVEKNLKKEAKKRGITPGRLIFSSKLPREEHLKRLQLVDIALDTRIYGGHTTTSDALWSGVPVVTLKGKHFASRVSASLLTAVGLSELITNTPKEYEDLAVELATNPKKLSAIRQKLSANRLTSSLFDTEKFTRNLEKAYEAIWKSYLKGESPKALEIS